MQSWSEFCDASGATEGDCSCTDQQHSHHQHQQHRQHWWDAELAYTVAMDMYSSCRYEHVSGARFLLQPAAAAAGHTTTTADDAVPCTSTAAPAAVSSPPAAPAVSDAWCCGCGCAHCAGWAVRAHRLPESAAAAARKHAQQQHEQGQQQEQQQQQQQEAHQQRPRHAPVALSAVICVNANVDVVPSELAAAAEAARCWLEASRGSRGGAAALAHAATERGDSTHADAEVELPVEVVVALCDGPAIVYYTIQSGLPEPEDGLTGSVSASSDGGGDAGDGAAAAAAATAPSVV
jgi:hypothetical protein